MSSRSSDQPLTVMMVVKENESIFCEDRGKTYIACQQGDGTNR